MKSKVSLILLLVFYVFVNEVIAWWPDPVPIKSVDPWYNTDWFWTALQALVILIQSVVILITLFYVSYQVRQQKLANMISSFESIDKRWESVEMRSARKEFCRKCKAGEGSITRMEQIVLGFFEDLGIYLEYGIYDLKIVWHKYSQDIEFYWSASRPLLQQLREIEGEDLYDHFDYLYNQMVKFGLSETPPIDISDKSPIEIQKFCERECEYLENLENTYQNESRT